MGTLLFLHVFGAVLFLGNIIVTAYWKVIADLSHEPKLMYGSSKKVLTADFVFTIPGLLLLIITGNIMAYRLGCSMNEVNWVSLSNWLFIFTGVIWLVVLIPLQLKMIRYSKMALSTGSVHLKYKTTSVYWMVFGTLATVIPLFILYLMTVKPF